MKKLITTLAALGFASAVFAQAPAPAAPATGASKPAATDASKPAPTNKDKKHTKKTTKKAAKKPAAEAK